jgi:hypothetical protein
MRKYKSSKPPKLFTRSQEGKKNQQCLCDMAQMCQEITKRLEKWSTLQLTITLHDIHGRKSPVLVVEFYDTGY